MARIIREIRPRYVFVENVPAITFRGFGTVLGDLASLGYDAQWGVLGTADAGGCCIGKRMWIVAQTYGPNGTARLGNFEDYKRGEILRAHNEEYIQRAGRAWMESPPQPCRMDFELANLVGRLKATGNGQDPAVAALAWRILSG